MGKLIGLISRQAHRKMEQEEVQKKTTVQNDTLEPERSPVTKPEEEENKENSSIMGVLESMFYNGAYFLGEKADILLSQAVSFAKWTRGFVKCPRGC